MRKREFSPVNLTVAEDTDRHRDVGKSWCIFLDDDGVCGSRADNGDESDRSELHGCRIIFVFNERSLLDVDCIRVVFMRTDFLVLMRGDFGRSKAKSAELVDRGSLFTYGTPFKLLDAPNLYMLTCCFQTSTSVKPWESILSIAAVERGTGSYALGVTFAEPHFLRQQSLSRTKSFTVHGS